MHRGLRQTFAHMGLVPRTFTCSNFMHSFHRQLSIFILPLLLHPLVATAQQVANAFTIHRLVSEAIAKHPSIEAADARAKAASDAIGAVRLWEDPELGLGGRAARKSMRMDDGDIRVSIDQKLPRRGLYEAEKRRATAEQQMQQAERRMKANELGLVVAQTVIELALADDTLNLQKQEVQWLETIVKTAQDRARNPDATAAESLRLESELALQTQKWEAAKRQRAQLARTLNIMLLRNAEAAWPVLALPDNDAAIITAASLRGQMEKTNPRLAALRNQVDAAQADTDAAKQKRKPVFSVGVETNTYSGGDFRDAMFMVRMSLPWFNRTTYQAEITKSESLKHAAESDLAAESREFYTKLTALITEAENNSRLAAAYQNEVLPKTMKAAEAIQNTWVSSKATLLEVLESRRALLSARQEQKRATAAHQAALQSIAAIVGSLVKPSVTKP